MMPASLCRSKRMELGHANGSRRGGRTLCNNARQHIQEVTEYTQRNVLCGPEVDPRVYPAAGRLAWLYPRRPGAQDVSQKRNLEAGSTWLQKPSAVRRRHFSLGRQ